MASRVTELFSSALTYHEAGQHDQAVALYRAVLDLDPLHQQSLNNLGMICYANKKFDLSINFFSTLIKLNAAHHDAYYNRGRVYQEINNLHAAVDDYRSALDICPAKPECLENIIAALADLGCFQECIEYCQERLVFRRDALALSSYGYCLYELGQFDKARDFYLQAQGLSAADPKLAVKCAHLELHEKNYAVGWELMQQRWNDSDFIASNFPKDIPVKKWSGEDLHGKKIYVFAEQGIGDEVMYASCVPDLCQAGAAVTLACDRRLVGVFRASFPDIEVLAQLDAHNHIWKGEDWLKYDFAISMADLPLFYRRESSSFDRKPWLTADPKKRQHWRRYLSRHVGPKIGISWRGGSSIKDQQKRSINLKDLVSAFAGKDVQLFSLQYDASAEERSGFEEGELHFADGLDVKNDIDSLLAFISELDCVISVDNCSVHFSGAVGVETKVLLPRISEWRWGLENTSDWYGDNLKLYRAQGQEITDSDIGKAISDLNKCASNCIEIPLPDHDSLPELKRNVKNLKKAVLLNDTLNWYHWGCSCTSIALRRGLMMAGYEVASLAAEQVHNIDVYPRALEQFDDQALAQQFSSRYQHIARLLHDADLVLINGEGTLHGASKAALSLLYLAYLAKKALNKTVHIVNHSCFPDDREVPKEPLCIAVYRKVYEALDFIAVRDKYSLEICRNFNPNVVMAFDCVPLFVRELAPSFPDKKCPVITVAGSVSLGDNLVQLIEKISLCEELDGYSVEVIVGSRANMAQDDVFFVEKVSHLLTDRVRVKYLASEVAWLNQIACSAVVISGRFHYSIAAACLGTPFLLFGSNTPKNQALAERLEHYPGFVQEASAEQAYRVLLDAMQSAENFLLSPDVVRGLEHDARNNFLAL